ncbi:MAG: tetratricopeptide repeat protein [Terriglobales bacterium]
MRRQWPLGILLVIVFLVYLPALRYSLVYDDVEQIVQNPRLTAWTYVPGYFTTHLWAHVPRTIQYYRPVFLLWLRLTYVLLGPPREIWHLGSILMHLVAIVSVFTLLRRLTGEDKAATLGAAFFALHPVQTEAVAWVSSVSEPLLTIFLVLSVYFYVARKGKVSAVSLLLATLAMLTKEAGLVAPVLIFAYEWTRSPFKKAVMGACPYLLPALLCIALRVNALAHFGAGRPPIMSVSHMILTWPDALLLYGAHLLWPVHLSAFYEVPIEDAMWPLLLLMVAVVGLTWVFRNWLANARFGAAWFAITLAPSLSLRYLNPGDFVHDRYLYLPLVGPALIVAAWLSQVSVTRARAIAAVAVALVLCVGVSVNLLIWRDDVSLFQRGIETAPHNPFVKLNLAVAYLNSDRAPEAVPLLQQAIQINPTYWRPYYVLGQYYQNTGDYAEAERYFSLSDQLSKR